MPTLPKIFRPVTLTHLFFYLASYKLNYMCMHTVWSAFCLMPKLLTCTILIFWLISVAEQAVFSLAWSETLKRDFLVSRPIWFFNAVWTRNPFKGTLAQSEDQNSWLSFVCLTVSLSLSHWYPGSGVVLDCINSWSLHPYLLKLRERTKKLIFLFLIQNICCGYSKEPSQWDSYFEHTKH